MANIVQQSINRTFMELKLGMEKENSFNFGEY